MGAVNDRPDGYAYSPRVRFEFNEKDLYSYRRAADFLNLSTVVHSVCAARVRHLRGTCRESPPGAAEGCPDANNYDAAYHPARVQERATGGYGGVNSALGSAGSDDAKGCGVVARDLPRSGTKDRRDPARYSGSAVHGPETLQRINSAWKAKAVLLTFGLISPGKGIEHVIEALPRIHERHPEMVYIVLGATHPNVIASDGESYRLSLERLAEGGALEKARHIL